MMNRFLMAQAYEALDRRAVAYEQIKTAEDISTWQAQRREFFLAQLGPFPARGPLNPRTAGVLPGDGYRIEKVIFDSQPGHHITANLYLPSGSGQHPAVLLPCGHDNEGKAAGSYQRAGILMARHGLAVLCYDPISQGERYQALDAEGKPLSHPTAEHTTVDMGSILLGTSTARYRIYDGMRALDYLESRPEIDATRLGCTGCSGGGTLTSYLMALDPRVACAAPVCFLTSLRRLLETLGPQDGEQNIHRDVMDGLDHADFIIMRAPKPTLLGVATRDFFDIEGAWDTFRQAKRIYGRLGFPERVELAEADEQHGYTAPLRVAVARWMRRWLLGVDEPITETDVPVRAPKELWCTPQGQVMLLEGERSVYQINAALGHEMEEARAAGWAAQSPDQRRAVVREAAGIRPLAELSPVTAQRLAVTPLGAGRVETWLLSPEPGIWLSALLFAPATDGGEACLYLHGGGKEADAGENGPIAARVAAGQTVLALELRGQGDEALGKLHKNWLLAYRLGRSYVGMRAEDILACAHWLAAQGAPDRPKAVHLVAVGEPGPAALHAAALEPEAWASVTLRHSLAAWADLLPAADACLANMVNLIHGALRVYDLPDLTALVGEKLKIIDPAGVCP